MAEKPEIQYLPFDWSDEYQPFPQKSPDDFIQIDHIGWFWLCPRDHEGNFIAVGDDFHDLREPLNIGKTTKFVRLRDYGTMTIIKNDDGTFSYDPPPEGPNWFCAVDDHDVGGTTIDEMLGELYDEPGPYVISMIEDLPSQPFILKMVDDKPTFVLCEAVH